jgi:threonine dehydrogenase-like Zn-dependent dehydrogenase
MRALVFDNELQYRTDYPEPVPDDNEALVKIRYAGICNTDIEITKGYMRFTGVLGHEFVGVVETSRGHDLSGKRVVAEINHGCGKCIYCENSMPTHCRKRSVLGILKKDGVFADYASLPEENLHVIPDSVSDEEAVFVEPLAAAFQITEQIPITDKDRVCVLGDGKLGLLAAQVLSATGCGLLVVGNHNEKLSILDELGIKTRLASSFNENGFDIVVDCTGSLSGIRAALRAVRPRGKIVLKTTVAKKGMMDLNAIVINEIALIGSRCGPFSPAINAIKNRQIDLYPLISREYGIEDGIKAFQYAARRDALKVVLKIS